MNIVISVPDDISQRLLLQWEDLSEHALEAVAVEAYREGVISESEVQKMINLSSRWEVDKLLKKHNAYIEYTDEDLVNDINNLKTAEDK